MATGAPESQGRRIPSLRRVKHRGHQSHRPPPQAEAKPPGALLLIPSTQQRTPHGTTDSMLDASSPSGDALSGRRGGHVGGTSVLTVAKITGGGAPAIAGHIPDVPAQKQRGDCYSSKDGNAIERAGRWVGGLAAALGLTGQCTRTVSSGSSAVAIRSLARASSTTAPTVCRRTTSPSARRSPSRPSGRSPTTAPRPPSSTRRRPRPTKRSTTSPNRLYRVKPQARRLHTGTMSQSPLAARSAHPYGLPGPGCDCSGSAAEAIADAATDQFRNRGTTSPSRSSPLSIRAKANVTSTTAEPLPSPNLERLPPSALTIASMLPSARGDRALWRRSSHARSPTSRDSNCPPEEQRHAGDPAAALVLATS